MTGALRLLFAVDLRRRRREILTIALVAGIAGSVALATAAGARRTSTALERFNRESRSADVEVTVGEPAPEQLEEFAAVPEVESVGRVYHVMLELPREEGSEFLPTAAAVDDAFGTVVDRARVIDGRLPNPADPHELALGERLAARLGVGVGDTLRADSYSPEEIATAIEHQTDPGAPDGPAVEMRIVGIVRRPLDLAARGSAGGVVVPTPAFLTRYRDEVATFAGTILRVRARNGEADLPAITAASRRIFGEDPRFDVQGLGVETEGPQDAIDVWAAALWVFAAIAALAGAAFVVILVTRHVGTHQAEQPVLAALGVTRRERALAVSSTAVPIAVLAAMLAVLGALLASSVFPFGIARRADPDVGMHVDWLVLGLGFVAIVLVIGAAAVLAGWRVARGTTSAHRRRTTARRPSPAVVAAHAGLAPPAVAGIGLAFEAGRGARAVPVRSAFTGAIVGAIGVVAVLVFAGSFDRLVSTPREYGWSFDAVMVDSEQGAVRSSVCGDVETSVTRDPAFEAVAAICPQTVSIEGRPVPAWSFTPLRGTIEPTTVAGRTPRADEEVALGASTLESIDKRVGDVVRIDGPGGAASYTVVGQIVLPSPKSLDPQPLADAASFTGGGLSRVLSSDPEEQPEHYLITRFAPGYSIASAPEAPNELARFASGTAHGPNVPDEIDRLQQIDRLPMLLGVFLALLAAGTIAHALMTTVRRRRAELAVLRTLGFTRRQVRSMVAWQATTLSVVALAIGIPVGVLVGGFVWTAVADGLGVSDVSSVSPLGLLVFAAAALLLVNALGALAAAAAVRAKPARILNVE